MAHLLKKLDSMEDNTPITVNNLKALCKTAISNTIKEEYRDTLLAEFRKDILKEKLSQGPFSVLLSRWPSKRYNCFTL